MILFKVYYWKKGRLGCGLKFLVWIRFFMHHSFWIEACITINNECFKLTLHQLYYPNGKLKFANGWLKNPASHLKHNWRLVIRPGPKSKMYATTREDNQETTPFLCFFSLCIYCPCTIQHFQLWNYFFNQLSKAKR